MNASPLVSAVIPVYNGRNYLRQAIESVLHQTYQPIELVVVDDGSTDDSREVLASYGERLSVICQPNRGVASARNAGIRAARGEWVAFLDQDDWWMPEKIERQVRAAAADEAIGLVHADLHHYDDTLGRYVERFSPGGSDHLSGWCYEQLLLGNGIFNCTAMVSTAVLQRLGGFNEEMPGNTVQDYELWLRVARDSKVAYVPDKLAVYRLHPGQGMWKVQKYLAAELEVLERFLGDFARLTSPESRARVVQILDELGVAHLDAGDHRQARACFRRALRLGRSRRLTLLYFGSFMPPAVLNTMRFARQRLRRALGSRNGNLVPAWARQPCQR
jgi:glycosyltransferase involved in cell wall biosynthesis